jgi:hypothetical protein
MFACFYSSRSSDYCCLMWCSDWLCWALREYALVWRMFWTGWVRLEAETSLVGLGRGMLEGRSS